MVISKERRNDKLKHVVEDKTKTGLEPATYGL
jgi:hypothetical protein